MNILYVSSNYEVVQPRLMESFQSLGHTTLLFHYEVHKKIPADGFPPYVILGRSKGISHGPVLYLYKLLIAYKQCLMKVKDRKIDIIHANMAFRDGYIARKISRKLGIPYVVSVRQADINSWVNWKIPYLKKIGYKNLKDASKIIFLSPVSEDILLGKVPERIKEAIISKACIIPNGIDDYYLDNLFYSHKKSDDLKKCVNLICVGKINRNKNVEALLAVCDLLKKRGIKAKLTVVGSIEDNEYLQMLNDSPYVNYTGRKNKEELIGIYRKSDIFILASHKESFGLVYAEAMSQGLPVLYTKGQGFDGQFSDGFIGYAVNDKDPVEITDRVIKTIENYEQISKRCTENASSFNRTKISKRIIDECYKGHDRL